MRCVQGATTLLLRKRGFFDAPFERMQAAGRRNVRHYYHYYPYRRHHFTNTYPTTHLITPHNHNHLSLRRCHHPRTRLPARNPIPAPVAVSYDVHVHTLYLARAPRACLLSVCVFASYVFLCFCVLFFVVPCARVSLLRFPHHHQPIPPPPPHCIAVSGYVQI